jgi:hypothetical protein
VFAAQFVAAFSLFLNSAVLVRIWGRREFGVLTSPFALSSIAVAALPARDGLQGSK